MPRLRRGSSPPSGSRSSLHETLRARQPRGSFSSSPSCRRRALGIWTRQPCSASSPRGRPGLGTHRPKQAARPADPGGVARLTKAWAPRPSCRPASLTCASRTRPEASTRLDRSAIKAVCARRRASRDRSRAALPAPVARRPAIHGGKGLVGPCCHRPGLARGDARRERPCRSDQQHQEPVGRYGPFEASRFSNHKPWPLRCRQRTIAGPGG